MVMEMFCISSGMMGTWMYTFIKTPGTVHLNHVCVSLYLQYISVESIFLKKDKLQANTRKSDV